MNMPPLLELPRELRDHIWVLACEGHLEWSSFGFGDSRKNPPPSKSSSWSIVKQPACSGSPHSLLRICRAVCREITPILYQNCCVAVLHSNQIVRWLGKIGAKNSSCIRHLVIRFSFILLGYNEEKYLKDRVLAWNDALRALPRLASLTFDFARDPTVSEPLGTVNNNMPLHDPVVGNELALSAIAWANRLQPSLERKDRDWEYSPELTQKRVTHAMLGMDESIPAVLLQYYAKLLDLSSSFSLEQSVTSLPEGFFEESGFHLARTYSFSENPETPSILMLFDKRPRSFGSPQSSLRITLDQLPDLLYLRVGCRSIDSSFLLGISPTIRTLDVAFTDTDPERIARNLASMRERCSDLFTLAVAGLSHLHADQIANMC